MKLRMTCQEVTRKLLLQREQPWAWHEQLAVRLHWMVCKGCQHFRGQARAMDQAMDAWRRYRDLDDA